MSRISIQLFGQFCVRRNEQVIGGFEAHKVQELFSYLLLHRNHSLSRESLASLLWPDCTTTTQPKKRLRQTLWHLQSALGSQSEAAHDRVLLVEPERVRINEEAELWLDVAVFEKTFDFVQSLAGQELDTQQVQALQKAVELYQGPLLEGCYEDWCLYEYVLVIEVQANKALATRSADGFPEPYRLSCRAVDLTEGGDSPPPMSFNVLEQFDNTFGWTDAGEELEAQKEYLIGHANAAPIPPNLKYHLFKYYVTLYTLIPPTDADGAESAVFLLT